MKAILEFTDNGEEGLDDISEMKSMLNHRKYLAAIYEISNVLRHYRKYDDSLTPDQYNLIDKIEDQFYEIVNEHNCNPNENY